MCGGSVKASSIFLKLWNLTNPTHSLLVVKHQEYTYVIEYIDRYCSMVYLLLLPLSLVYPYTKIYRRLSLVTFIQSTRLPTSLSINQN